MSGIDFLAGCLGGAAGVLIGHPLDTVKVKLQTQGMLKNLHGSSTSTSPGSSSSSRILYRGTLHCLLSTYQQERVKKLLPYLLHSLICINHDAHLH